MTLKIPVVVRTQDCGDGGYNISIYNSEEELLADHEAVQSAIEDKMPLDALQDIKNDILNEDDPYQNGYISHENIEIEIVDGVPKIVGSLCFHAGQ